ncbi:SDR family oxidoreductase [Parachlamydia acanthamoebae]|jgi:uncharacterized protein YbjT (DUF2867 family)|uniref:SDR family oxidoreductase n=1 Tax=Parachlamydia acanthamoebae TaxID=83552 RepID=UPI0007516598|nr:SDR family oxidoreductase [Parachlamydia acanthamoebae]
MKIVVIGGTGLIGSKLVSKLRNLKHEVIAASPSKGINATTGEGLSGALKGADIVVDVANSPSFEDKAVLDFFETSSRNLLAAEKVAGVRYHIALSVVGTDLLTESGYFRAKIAQENLIKASNIPYTIIRATQFFEFLGSIAQASTVGEVIHLPATAFLQPIAAEDVAEAILRVISEAPINGIIEIAGPECFLFPEIVGQYLKETQDPRTVVPDAQARYFGMELKENSLTPSSKNPRLGSTDFKTWFQKQKSIQGKNS